MGQSIAVKSDQLAYLVPAECLAISRETGNAVAQRISNPMLLEEYKTYIQGNPNVLEVSADIACEVLGGKKLSDYGIITEGEKPMYQKFFKRVNSEITLVYYYVFFDSESQASVKHANEYFQDFYKVNKATMDAYASIYTDGIKLRNAGEGFYTLHLAGNMVCETAEGNGLIKEATLAHDAVNVGYQNVLIDNQYKFKALTKKIVDVYELLTPTETMEGANPYNNLVREDAVSSYYASVSADAAVETGSAKYFGSTNEKAVIVDGDYVYTGSGQNAFDGLIIATGNVEVKHDFHGTILSGGNITLEQNVKVAPDKDAVLHALTYSNIADGLEYHVTDFLIGGEGYLKGVGKTYLSSDINIGELVVYENWEKQ